MGYELLGRMHAEIARRLTDPRGQGTVEYVGLILLVAVIVAGVVSASKGIGDKGIAETIVKKLKGAVDGVGAVK
jgi:Flp pilus assembly pilin Flp